MNKRNIFTFLLAIIAMVGQAQEISKAEPTANDYIKLLNKQGYHVIALDLSKLEKNKYLMSPVIQVWSKGEMQQNLMEDWSVAYTNEAPKMTVNLMPKNDTLFVCNFQFDDVCGFGMDLPMPAVKNEADGSEIRNYVCRSFVIQPEWKENELIPIAAYCSSWYYAKDKICCNCDVNEFDKDYLNSTTFRNSPCIYVFGITIKKI